MIAVVNYESKTVFWKDSQKPLNNMFQNFDWENAKFEDMLEVESKFEWTK